MTTLESLTARYAMTSEHRTALMQSTAEYLAMPQRGCTYRSCRRDGCCGYFLTQSGEPTCLANLDQQQRACFDAIFKIVDRIYQGWNNLTPSSDAGRHDDEWAAIVIINASLNQIPEVAGRVKDWIAHYLNPPPPRPPVDIKALLIEAKAELARGEHALGLFEARERAVKQSRR